jgi:hypothetical protein
MGEVLTDVGDTCDARDTCCSAKSNPASSSSEYAVDENEASGEDIDTLAGCAAAAPAACVYGSLPSQSELDPDPASYSYS